uniref:Uncharacterized protein AlNc14C33G2983 n=1 Tax=Albugo laibachii Nc14 TaxID=890382 RepID=F0W889_9STRA|nr:conserved hypothetical protein [Albugo laibachii Nc14]|eukprot:CCA17289.1 conserved hypothetical protein [Albugo laibachii Nc14]
MLKRTSRYLIRSHATSNSLSRIRSKSTQSSRHNFFNSKFGVGNLELTSEEVTAEQDLAQNLPDFQLAINGLFEERSSKDHGRGTHTNFQKVASALPHLERTADICRSSMGFNNPFLLVSLRYLCLAYFIQGKYSLANKIMQERGEAMDWPIVEQERMLRLQLRQNRHEISSEVAKLDTFKALYPNDELVPLKWTMYELIAKYLQFGPKELDTMDPLYAVAAEKLRRKKGVVKKEQEVQPESLHTLMPLDREVPFLLSQFASLCYVVTESQQCTTEVLGDNTTVYLDQAEILWKEALHWVEHFVEDAENENNKKFQMCVQMNLGEVCLTKKKPIEAIEFLEKALQLQQTTSFGSELVLARVLGRLAEGYHALEQPVNSEGLFQSAVEAYEKTSFLSLTQQMEYAGILRKFGKLLGAWEKRDTDAQNRFAKADTIEQEIGKQLKATGCKYPFHSAFYLPLDGFTSSV